MPENVGRIAYMETERRSEIIKGQAVGRLNTTPYAWLSRKVVCQRAPGLQSVRVGLHDVKFISVRDRRVGT